MLLVLILSASAMQAATPERPKPLTMVLVEHEDLHLVSWLITTLEIVLH